MIIPIQRRFLQYSSQLRRLILKFWLYTFVFCVSQFCFKMHFAILMQIINGLLTSQGMCTGLWCEMTMASKQKQQMQKGSEWKRVAFIFIHKSVFAVLCNIRLIRAVWGSPKSGMRLTREYKIVETEARISQFFFSLSILNTLEERLKRALNSLWRSWWCHLGGAASSSRYQTYVGALTGRWVGNLPHGLRSSCHLLRSLGLCPWGVWGEWTGGYKGLLQFRIYRALRKIKTSWQMWKKDLYKEDFTRFELFEMEFKGISYIAAAHPTTGKNKSDLPVHRWLFTCCVCGD